MKTLNIAVNGFIAVVLAIPAFAGNSAIDEAAAEKGAIKTPSGMVYKSIREGSGKTPGPLSTVEVNYQGTLTNGLIIDSSYKRNQSSTFPLNRVIRCWREGVQMMKVGGKAQLVCPPELAYGSTGAGSEVPPDATLIFVVELLDIK